MISPSVCASGKSSMVLEASLLSAAGYKAVLAICLLDSGASASFITEKLARRLHLVITRSSMKAITTASGESVPVILHHLTVGSTECV